LVCPGCNKATDWVAEGLINPHLKCGDCLMDRCEVVELKIVKIGLPGVIAVPLTDPDTLHTTLKTLLGDD
jgi:hypothetical protein